MRCKKACEYLSLEIDGLLPPAAAPELEEHLDACNECRSFRVDLQTGRRLLKATDPQLSENFEWRLQLRLNQTLQEAAGQAAYPWVEPEGNPWNWLRNFGTAAAVGMAAVLAFALFLGPAGYQSSAPLADSVSTPGGEMVAANQLSPALTSDRLPLGGGRSVSSSLGASSQRQVSAGGLLNSQTPFSLARGWSGQRMEDQRTIWLLRNENKALAWRVSQLQRTLDAMRAQLDTNATNALDLKLEQ